jgi:hypothetical protein
VKYANRQQHEEATQIETHHRLAAPLRAEQLRGEAEAEQERQQCLRLAFDEEQTLQRAIVSSRLVSGGSSHKRAQYSQ